MTHATPRTIFKVLFFDNGERAQTPTYIQSTPIVKTRRDLPKAVISGVCASVVLEETGSEIHCRGVCSLITRVMCDTVIRTFVYY